MQFEQSSCKSLVKQFTPIIILKGAFTHTRGERRLASSFGGWARRGETTFASPRLCMYGLASRSGATTIQSYKTVQSLVEMNIH